MVSLDEVAHLRRQVEAGIIRIGTLYAHYRRFTPDWNNGICQRCLNDTFGGEVDEDCPVCFGTGWDGGFSKPTVQYMMIQVADEVIERTELGVVRLVRSDSVSPFLPKLQTGDMIARVVEDEGSFGTQERYVIEGTVRPQRMREDRRTLNRDPASHLQADPEVLAYNFDTSLLEYHLDEDLRDISYKVPFENAVWLADPREIQR